MDNFGDFMRATRVFAVAHVLQADRAYLNSLIDGSGDLLAEDTFERMEPMFERYPEGTEMFALLEQAATVYADAAVAAATWAIAGWVIQDARRSTRDY
ncbi:hypothetical protein ACSFBI_01400 [Variovorax sp. RB3P1]|uniref:hypothetical protein n=1 Tax=Variovorax sp. RB3P1 TaxID=3443732 RepID=UPI003F4877F3